MATHSRVLPWRIPGMGEPGGLLSLGSHRVGHMNSMKRQNDRILKEEELPRSVGAQYATGNQWRNNSRKNEGMEPKLHSWVFFLLWLHPFILSGVISPLISSSILGTY